MILKSRFNQWRFNRSVRAMDDTPPLASGPLPLVALSMVQHRDVLPYLLALKSFARHHLPQQVVVVADPTLDESDRKRIRRHVPHVEFREAAEFQRQEIPQGGCWERLCAISEYCADSYVVQLDADTVTLAGLPEVESALKDGTAFTLGTEDDSRIVSCEAISAWARRRLQADEHVQLIAEAKLADIEGADELRYVRGCAGFAGYPRGSFNYARLASLSVRMRRLMPEHWDKWGSEQFTSNLLIASMENALVLPHPRYCAPHRRSPDTRFLHFIGYVRYTTGLYAHLAWDIAARLQSA